MEKSLNKAEVNTPLYGAYSSKSLYKTSAHTTLCISGLVSHTIFEQGYPGYLIEGLVYLSILIRGVRVYKNKRSPLVSKARRMDTPYTYGHVEPHSLLDPATRPCHMSSNQINISTSSKYKSI